MTGAIGSFCDVAHGMISRNELAEREFRFRMPQSMAIALNTFRLWESNFLRKQAATRIFLPIGNPSASGDRWVRCLQLTLLNVKVSPCPARMDKIKSRAFLPGQDRAELR